MKFPSEGSNVTKEDYIMCEKHFFFRNRNFYKMKYVLIVIKRRKNPI